MEWPPKSALVFRSTTVALATTMALLIGVSVPGQAPVKLLLIGTSGKLSMEEDKKDDATLETLKSFIKEETSFDNEIRRQKDWRDLTDKMVKGELQLGFFQGYEFAWARKSDQMLEPLALAINVHTYSTNHVVTQRASPARDFSGIKGQSLALSKSAQRSTRLFLEHRCAKEGNKPEDFFSKLVTPEPNANP